MMKFTLLAFALASAVYAQTLTPCITGCINTSGHEAGCSSLDVVCMCTTKQFRADMHACLAAECTPADMIIAGQLDAEFCGTP